MIAISVIGGAFEEWRTVAGWPEYEVSNLGRVRRVGAGVLKATPARNGYPRVTLCRSGRNHYQHVHVLVCVAFHGAKPSIVHEVAHADGQRTNVRADNLRWATFSENMRDKQRHLMAKKKLTAADVQEIRRSLREGISARSLAKKYNVDKANVARIRDGKIWAWLA